MNSSIEIFPGEFSKSLVIPTSKSYANRLLILASIFPGEISIESLPEATDVTNLVKCLEKIGLEIKKENDRVTIFKSFPYCEKPGEIILETGDGGTTNRFLMALLARGNSNYVLKPDPLFLKRPIDPFLRVLSENGVLVSRGENFIKIRGPISQKEIKIDSSFSSQFASAIALALADSKVKVFPENLSTSTNYFSLTSHLIKKFQQGIRSFKVPLDFSSLSYPLALAAVFGSVQIENYNAKDSFQGDSIFLNILAEAGAYILEDEKFLKVEKSAQLKPLEIDCSNCLDLVPTLSFLFSHIPGKSILKNIRSLSYKESDRVLEIKKLLNLFKKESRLTKDFDLEIIGDIKKRDFVEYEAPKDHRMIMTASLFMKVNSGGVIQNFEGVNKSFPGFFNLIKD